MLHILDLMILTYFDEYPEGTYAQLQSLISMPKTELDLRVDALRKAGYLEYLDSAVMLTDAGREKRLIKMPEGSTAKETFSWDALYIPQNFENV